MVEPMGRQIRVQVFYLIIPDNFHGLVITRLTEHHTGKSDASSGITQTCYLDCAQHAFRASQVALMVRNSPGSAGDLEVEVLSLGREDPLAEGTAAHPRTRSWRIPWQRRLQATVPGVTEADATEVT